MTIELLLPKPMTPARSLAAHADPGRKIGRVHGGWIADLVGLRKCIILCPFCKPKFNPKKHEYVPWRRDTFCVSKCDACKELDPRCVAFIHETLIPDVGETPRRRGRWAR